MLSQEDEKLKILSLSYLECTFGIIQFQSMKQEGKLVRSAWRQDVLLWGDSWPTFACLLRINYLILCISSQRPPGAVLHSSNEPGELSQWLCHADSTINIVLDIIIIIIIVIIISWLGEVDVVDVCFSDKHSKRARDMHLLKQLKLLLRDQVTESGMSSKKWSQLAYFVPLIYCVWLFVCVLSQYYWLVNVEMLA